MEARERVVEYYVPLPMGSPAPFGVWRDGYGDQKVRSAIDARIARLRGGNFSNSRALGEGVSESKIDLGPGYRIYYGVDGNQVWLLWGGEKSGQDADIATAKKLWKEHKERKKIASKKPKLQKRSSR